MARKDISATINVYGNYGNGTLGVTAVTSSLRNHPYNVVGRGRESNTILLGSAFTQAFDIADGINDFTGSRAGVCGVNVLTHGSAVLHLTGGGTVAAAELESDNGVIVPIAIKQVTAADSAAITVYR